MDQKQLEYFVSVAKHRNFTKAAAEYFLSQPAFSHQIKTLEKELGCELFIRNTRSVTLTESGELFLEEAKKILAEMELAKQKVQLAHTEPAIIRIAYLAAPTQHFLPDMVYQFRRQYPHIQVKLYRMDALQIAESALRRECDIYFSILEDLNSNSELSTRKILSDSLCLVTRKDHPALAAMPLDYNKLASEPFLVFRPEHAQFMNNRVLELCDALGFKPRVKSTYDLYETLLCDIEAGIGISILPYRSRMYQNTNLSFTLLDLYSDSLNIGIAWHKKITNAAIPLFTEFFRGYLQEHPEHF